MLTHLAKQCQPLVRFRSGDIITLTATGTARCGRTAPRFRVVGRSDDMVVVRGLNMFPAMVAGVIAGFAELSGEYRIVLDTPPPHDFLPVEAELAAGGRAEPGLAAAVAARIKSTLGATARVQLCDFNTLPRSEGKTRRVIRSHR